MDFFRSDLWVGYPAAASVLDDLERLYSAPDSGRPENMLLISETNNGKSRLMRRFKQLHPDIDDPMGEGVQVPVVLIDAPATPDEDRFYNHLLMKMGVVFKMNAKKDAKLFQILTLLQDMNTQMLIIDEFNNSLAGTATQRQQLFNAIKGLSNELKRPIVLTGAYEVRQAMRADKQIQNRFPPRVLPKWELDEDYLQLLASFESVLPLRRDSNLIQEGVALLLLTMSNRNIGELKRLLTWALGVAMETEEERITEKLLRGLPWVPPDLRDQAADVAEDGGEIDLDLDDRLEEIKQSMSDRATSR